MDATQERRSATATKLFATALLLVALSPGSTAAPPLAPERTRAGSQQPLPSLEPVTRIGCNGCSDERAVTPTVLAVLDDGRIAELDRFEPFVRVFRQDGDLDVAFGTKGQGPGDLGFSAGGSGWIAGIYLIPEPGGGASVVNALPPGLETFDAGGGFVAETDFRLANALPHAQAFSPEARIYYRFASVPFSDAPDMIDRCVLAPGAAPDCEAFIDPSSFIEPEYPAPSPVRQVRPSLAATPEGDLVAADPGTYRVWILDDEGNVRIATHRDIERIEKNADEIEAEELVNERLGPGRSRPIDPLRAYLDRVGIQVDGEGHIWLLTQRHNAANSVFDVLDRDGEFLAEITIDAVVRTGPWHIEPFAISGDLLAAIFEFPDGNFGIDVYRIVQR